MDHNENHGMGRLEWMLLACCLIGAMALAFVGDYPEWMKL